MDFLTTTIRLGFVNSDGRYSQNEWHGKLLPEIRWIYGPKRVDLMTVILCRVGFISSQMLMLIKNGN